MICQISDCSELNGKTTSDFSEANILLDVVHCYSIPLQEMFIMLIASVGNATEAKNIIFKSKQSELGQAFKNILTTYIATEKKNINMENINAYN